MSNNDDHAPESLKRLLSAKGDRPNFFTDKSQDKLLAMLMAVVAELAVVRERLDTHERLANREQLPKSDDVESFKADSSAAAERSAWRDDYIARVMRIITNELDDLRG